MDIIQQDRSDPGDMGWVIIHMFWGAPFGYMFAKGAIMQNASDDTFGWICIASFAITLVIITLLTINIKTKSEIVKHLLLLLTAGLLNFVLIIVGQFLVTGFVVSS